MCLCVCVLGPRRECRVSLCKRKRRTRRVCMCVFLLIKRVGGQVGVDLFGARKRLQFLRKHIIAR